MSNLAHDYKPDYHVSEVPDTPITHSLLYASRTAKRHFGFFPFFTKKPWAVIQKYIEYYSQPGDLVCDPFSGSGVTAVESLILGRKIIAGDINPLSLFITKMTAVSPVNLELLTTAFQKVEIDVKDKILLLNRLTEMEIIKLLEDLNYPRVVIPSTVKRANAQTVDQMHTPRQLAGLSILRESINKETDEIHRDLLKVALAQTVKFANKTYNLPTNRGSVYGGDSNIFRRYSYSFAKQFHEHTVWDNFGRAFKNVLAAKKETNALIGMRYARDFQLANTSVSQIHEVTGEERVDYFFADPPYGNDINFVDLSTLWNAWLDLEISEEIRQKELIERPKEKNRQQFISEFSDAISSISKALKNERWFTLVYKHRDLTLWGAIINACEENNLEYINAVWQKVNIPTTRQLENPNFNPSGDMYLNFRKLSRKSYPKPNTVDIPNFLNYVEKDTERIIVSYLGADIELLYSSLVRNFLNSRLSILFEENTRKLNGFLKQCLELPKFQVWKAANEPEQWILKYDYKIDDSILSADRIRYYLFDYFLQNKEKSEGDINTYLLTVAAQQNIRVPTDFDVRKLLPQVAEEIQPRFWSFSSDRVTKYKQLRLFFEPSRADSILEAYAHASLREAYLQPDFDGLFNLYTKLVDSNKDNREFNSQYNSLFRSIKEIANKLDAYFAEQVISIVAYGEWVNLGIDLRDYETEEIVVGIVLNTEEASYKMHKLVSEKVFLNLDDDFLIQFNLIAYSDWKFMKKSKNQTEILSLYNYGD